MPVVIALTSVALSGFSLTAHDTLRGTGGTTAAGGGGGGRRRRARKPYGAVLQCPRVAVDYSLGGLLRLPLDALEAGGDAGSGAELWKSVQQTVQSHPFASVGVTAQLGSFTRPLLDFSRVRSVKAAVGHAGANELGEMEPRRHGFESYTSVSSPPTCSFPPTCAGG
jgi:hypothetical protein